MFDAWGIESAKVHEPKRPKPFGAPASATTLRRGLNSTEYLYVKLPCPSVHTSYSRYSSNATFVSRTAPTLNLVQLAEREDGLRDIYSRVDEKSWKVSSPALMQQRL